MKSEKKFVLRKRDAFLTVTLQVYLNLVWCLKNKHPVQLISSAQQLSGDDDDGKGAGI